MFAKWSMLHKGLVLLAVPLLSQWLWIGAAAADRWLLATVGAGVVSLVVAGLAWAIHEDARKRLFAIAENALRVSRGQAPAPRLDGKDEIARVDRAFHVMADALRLAEEDSRRSSAEIRALYNQAPCGYHSIGPDGTFLEVNDTELRWLGYGRDEVIGKLRFSDLLDARGKEVFRESLARLKSAGALNNVELQLHARDGGRIPILLSATAIRDQQGKFVAGRSSIVSIVERKRADDALRTSEQRFRLLVDRVVDYAIVVLNVKGRVVGWNSGAERITGYKAHEVVGKHFSCFYPAEALEQNWPEHELEMAASTGRFEDEGWRLRKDGTRYWANVVITALYDNDGALEGYCKITRDLTERRRIEQELEEQRALLQAVLDCMGDGVIVADESGKFLIWNPATQRIVGLGPSAVKPEDWPAAYGAFRPDTVTPFPADELPLVRALRGCDSENVRIFARNPAIPEGKWVSITARPLRDKDGRTRGGVAVLRDITAQKHAEDMIQTLNTELEERVIQRTAELAEANRELEHKNQENETFVYSVSHDLRSPLVNLEGFSRELALIGDDLRNLLQDDIVPPSVRQRGLALLNKDMAEAIRFIQSAVKRLSSIIDALLRLSRAGRVEYQWQTVAPRPMLTRIVEAMANTIAERQASVTIQEMPPLWGDPTALEQVFANLLGNAVNYLAAARPGQVEIGCTSVRDGQAIYYVRDNGIGIAQEFQHKIFQAFQRLHPEASSGEGMGLTLVQRIIERHRGRIWIESELNRGSTFFVALPTKPASG